MFLPTLQKMIEQITEAVKRLSIKGVSPHTPEYSKHLEKELADVIIELKLIPPVYGKKEDQE